MPAFDLSSLERVPLRLASQLPDRPGVYFFVRRTDDTVLYIGRSSNLRRRITAGHHIVHRVADIPTDIAFCTLPLYALNFIESWLIAEFCPPFNTIHVKQS